jgi:hypothetical protein
MGVWKCSCGKVEVSEDRPELPAESEHEHAFRQVSE